MFDLGDKKKKCFVAAKGEKRRAGRVRKEEGKKLSMCKKRNPLWPDVAQHKEKIDDSVTRFI